MAIIAPTVTVETPEAYKTQLEKIDFAERIHIDVADNEFTPRQLLPVSQVYLPANKECDVHVMLKRPGQHIFTLISLRPSLVVLHAEAEGDLAKCFEELRSAGIKAGVALLPETQVQDAAAPIALADHVLIFAGHLGYQGGEADISQTAKIADIRVINSHCEIGWDGGVNGKNAAQLLAAGVTILNVGGFIHKASDPRAAYEELTQLS